jgi:hypothetical protein
MTQASAFCLIYFCLSTGLYGHSAVYHEQTDAVYVFGGYRFHVETVEPSGELYSLYYPNLTWSLLVPSQGNKAGPSNPGPLLGVQESNTHCSQDHWGGIHVYDIKSIFLDCFKSVLGDLFRRYFCSGSPFIKCFFR